MTPLYSLRTDGQANAVGGYRITKFVDGDVESSYLVHHDACECPAGHRHTCRHRQMLPQMLAHKLCDTHWFFCFDTGGQIVDFNGTSKHLLDQLAAPVEYRCSKCGAQADERFDCCEVHSRTQEETAKDTLSIAHSITLSDEVTSKDVANAFVGIIQGAKSWRRL